MRRLVFTLLLAAGMAFAQAVPIDATRSAVRVHVGRAGLFGAFGHDHEISADKFTGTIDREAGTVQLKIDTRAMRVLDPEVKETTRAEIQQDMMSAKVLDVERYPEISFRSTSATRNGTGWVVDGEITLHGVTRPVRVNVEELEGRYSGKALLKQSDFGIKPIAVAGGTVKVKDEITIQFTIYPKKSERPHEAALR